MGDQRTALRRFWEHHWPMREQLACVRSFGHGGCQSNARCVGLNKGHDSHWCVVVCFLFVRGTMVVAVGRAGFLQMHSSYYATQMQIWVIIWAKAHPAHKT